MTAKLYGDGSGNSAFSFDPTILQDILNTFDEVTISVFDENRKVLYSNKTTSPGPASSYPAEGSSMGAAETDHFEYNTYFDENGNRLDYPKGSAVDRALHGESTRDLLLEHRNKKNHTHSW